MNRDEFKTRTKSFALRAIRLSASLPRTVASQLIGRQLVRSATSVGANYRSACLARSRADFIAKMKIVEEECDESLYWMELLVESSEVKLSSVTALVIEAKELLSMVVASIKTARSTN